MADSVPIVSSGKRKSDREVSPPSRPAKRGNHADDGKMRFFVTYGCGLHELVVDELEHMLAVKPGTVEDLQGKMVFQTASSASKLGEMRSIERAGVVVGLQSGPPALPPPFPQEQRRQGVQRLAQALVTDREFSWSKAVAAWLSTTPHAAVPTFRVRCGFTSSITLPAVTPFDRSCKLRGQATRGYNPHEVAEALSGALAERMGWTAAAKHDVEGLEVMVHTNDRHVLVGLPLFRTRGVLSQRSYLPHEGLRSVVACYMAHMARRHCSALSRADTSPSGAAAVVIDPMCGVGTCILEAAVSWRSKAVYFMGDSSPEQVTKATENRQALLAELARRDNTLPSVCVEQWRAERLPVPSSSVDVVLCDLPFGRKHGTTAANHVGYPLWLREFGRVLVCGGVLTMLTSESLLINNCLGQTFPAADMTPHRDQREEQQQQRAAAAGCGQREPARPWHWAELATPMPLKLGSLHAAVYVWKKVSSAQ